MGFINYLEYPSDKGEFEIGYNSIEYEICINFRKNKYEVIKENVKFDYEIIEKDNPSKIISKNVLLLKNHKGEISAEIEKNDELNNLEFFAPESLIRIVNNNFKQKHGLIINSPLASIPISWSDFFKNINYHDFDPKICKMAYGNGNSTLSEYGDNLSLILDNILNDEDEKIKFLNLTKHLLPYIEDIKVDKIFGEQKIFILFEKYDKSPVFAPFASDGTVNILALISALYFNDGEIILIEEPERNIHPRLFISLVNMMKEISTNKQIIITTHSPEILDYCDLNDILLISRDSEGFSNITKPHNNKEVKEFTDELGIGNVFLNNYLGF